MVRPRVVSCSAAQLFKLRNTPEEKLFPGSVVPPASPLRTDACVSTVKGSRGQAATAQVAVVAQKQIFGFERQTT